MLYCYQEKETGTLLFSRRRKLVHYCSREKEKGALVFLGKRHSCSIVFRMRDLVLYCSQGGGDWSSTVFERRAIWAMYQVKLLTVMIVGY